MREREREREIVEVVEKAIAGDLVPFLEMIRKMRTIELAIQQPNALRLVLEKLDGVISSPTVALDLAKLSVHVEYLIAKRMIERDIETILRTLVWSLLHRAKNGKLEKKNLELAKTMVEAIFSAVVKARNK